MKKTISHIIVSLFVLSLSGCASGPSYVLVPYWKKNGASYEQARAQANACSVKARNAAERETQVDALFESCMTLEGYSWGNYKKIID